MSAAAVSTAIVGTLLAGAAGQAALGSSEAVPQPTTEVLILKHRAEVARGMRTVVTGPEAAARRAALVQGNMFSHCPRARRASRCRPCRTIVYAVAPGVWHVVTVPLARDPGGMGRARR